MSNHTPGPWVVDVYTNIMAVGGLVAFPGISAGFDQKANARLIAAAPDLLDALFTALPFVEDAADDEIYKSHRVHVALKEIRAAIAKATGDKS